MRHCALICHRKRAGAHVRCFEGPALQTAGRTVLQSLARCLLSFRCPVLGCAPHFYAHARGGDTPGVEVKHELCECTLRSKRTHHFKWNLPRALKTRLQAIRKKATFKNAKAPVGVPLVEEDLGFLHFPMFERWADEKGCGSARDEQILCKRGASLTMPAIFSRLQGIASCPQRLPKCMSCMTAGRRALGDGKSTPCLCTLDDGASPFHAVPRS